MTRIFQATTIVMCDGAGILRLALYLDRCSMQFVGYIEDTVAESNLSIAF